MKKNRCKYVLCVFGLLFHTLVYGQYNFSGSVVNPQKEALPGATIMLYAADSLIGGTITDAKGLFELKNLPKNECLCIISMLGYQTQEHPIDLAQPQQSFSFTLQENAEKLDVLTIEADRRDLVKAGAGYTSYTLSRQALEATTIYESLREIPKLIIDESNQRILLSSGEEPYILVNGVHRPGTLFHIDPQSIQSIEIIENPSAKYRGDQTVSKILNIKVKREREKSYLATHLRSRHQVDAGFGVSGGSFEAGNSNASFYLEASHFYFRNDDIGSQEYSQTSTLARDLSGQRRYDANSVDVTIGGDWLISEKDYLSWAAMFSANPQHTKGSQSGTIAESPTWEASPLTTIQSFDNSYFRNAYNLYYKHTFREKDCLELKGSFGWFQSGSEGNRQEESSFYRYDTNVDLKSQKKSLNVDINYDWHLADKLKLDFGANTYMYHSTVDDRTGINSFFRSKELTEYLYGDVSHDLSSRLSYQLSLGVDLSFTDVGGRHNHYVNFVPGASVSYMLNDQSYLQLYYIRQRTSPDISQLNPNNTSTDSLRQQVGNPYLKPYVNNSIYLIYAWNHKGFYLSPFVVYENCAKNIMQVGYQKGNMYVQTYENLGNYHLLRVGLDSRINLSTFGNLNAGVFFQKHFIDGMPYSGRKLGGTISLNLYYKRVSFYSYVNFTGYNYTKTGKTYNTPESEATFSWKLPKNWVVNAGLRFFAAGDHHFATWLKNQDYYYRGKSVFGDRYMMPMIGLSYTFKNKVKQQQRQQKRLQNTDAGVNKIVVE